MIRSLAASIAVVCPQPLKRWIYRRVMRWTIHPSVRIGFTFILVESLVVEEGVSVSHFNVIKGCDLVVLKAGAMIGAFNWISGKPSGSGMAPSSPDRRPQLIVGRESGITMRHLIDCSDAVTIGDFSIVAGFRCQILTHGIDVADSRQEAAPVTIGDRTVVFSGVILLAGSCVASRCVVAAGAVVTGELPEELRLYGGVPARAIKVLPPDHKFFTRERGLIT